MSRTAPTLRGARCSAYTTIELVVVMLVIGILAAFTIPKFTGRNAFDTRGYADRVRSAIDYAQKLAIARRRNVCVAVATTSITVTRAAAEGPGAACAVAVVDPATGADFSTYAIPTGVSLSSSASPITFDALGSPGNADITVTVTGEFSTPITVEKVTGHVH